MHTGAKTSRERDAIELFVELLFLSTSCLLQVSGRLFCLGLLGEISF